MLVYTISGLLMALLFDITQVDLLMKQALRELFSIELSKWGYYGGFGVLAVIKWVFTSESKTLNIREIPAWLKK